MFGELSEFEVLSVIAPGSFGACYKVQRKTDNAIFMWKAFAYGTLKKDQKKSIKAEISLRQSIQHSYLLHYYGYINHKASHTMYIVMEHCQNGDLAVLIASCKCSSISVEEAFVWKFLHQIGTALKALKQYGIIYRSVNPSNIFLDDKYNVKIGDFGIQRLVKMTDFAQVSACTMSMDGETYGKNSDLWALGCVAYELCALEPPFKSHNWRQLSAEIAAGRFECINSNYSPDMHRIIAFLLTLNAMHPPDVSALLNHPSVVTKLLECQNSKPVLSHTSKAASVSSFDTGIKIKPSSSTLKVQQSKGNHMAMSTDQYSTAEYEEIQPTSAKLNPALIQRPTHFVHPKRVRFEHKAKDTSVTYTWYEIDNPKKIRKPLSDSSQANTRCHHMPDKAASDGGHSEKCNNHKRGKYTFKDLEKAVSDMFVQSHSCACTKDKENKVPIKHTKL